MTGSRPNFFWPLRLIAVFSLVGPALLFSYATLQNHRAIDEQANERIERALDVLQEHSLKAIQTVERAISEVNEVLRGMSDEEIRASESDLFLRLKRTQQALPQMESIWAFDRDGHPLVSSTILPVPRDLDNSDRSYFRVQAETDAGTYISEVIRARIGTLRFFVVSARRHGEKAGRFEGVIGVTVMPEHFSEFYRKLERGRDSFALLRSDGTILARFPEARLEDLALPNAVSAEIAKNPAAGRFTGVSPIDGVERRIGYRRVPGVPVYVQAGVETAALRSEFLTLVSTQFALGLPAVLAMFALALYALRRAQRFQEETVRREVAEAALKQAQRLEAIGQLTGGVAHDFNNLLMVVSGNVERIKRSVSDSERMSRAFDAIETAVRRGTTLTGQLLSFSRRQTHEARIIDLGERLPAVQDMLRSSLRGDIVVETRLPDAVWPVHVDVSELELALLNLAVNARDAMAVGGQILISAENVTLGEGHPSGLAGDFVAVGVEDTGEGIAPDLLGRVFEPFFTTKDVGKGTGLGLSQVYGFARQAGGTATVVSEPGRGTTVTIYLPRSQESPEAPAGESVAVATPLPLGERRHVLLVEDNSEVAGVARGLLEDLGYQVLDASDVAQALSVWESRRGTIGMLVSDIVMPGGAHGIDLAQTIRRECGPGFPIILTTGYSKHAQQAADDNFLILRKPYGRVELNAAIALAGKSSGASQTCGD